MIMKNLENDPELLENAQNIVRDSILKLMFNYDKKLKPGDNFFDIDDKMINTEDVGYKKLVIV